jgi:hypothetical protein
MPQKVSHSAVHFNLDEVATLSEEIKPISVEAAQNIKDAFPIDFFKQNGFEVSIRELEMGSIHRHPGNFGFSSTDLDNEVENPGVIFRNLGCTDKIQVDSVMYIPGETVTIVTTETRIVTVEKADDDGIKGEYLETPTINYIVQDGEQPEDFSEFFGAEKTDEDSFKYIQNQTWLDKKYPEIKDIFDVFLTEAEEYNPIVIVDPSFIEQETWTYGRYQKTTSKSYNYYDNYGLDDDGLGNSWDDETYLPASSTSPKKKESLLRPGWRKNQTLSKLRVLKIDLTKHLNIDGSAEDEDIIAIVKAMKEAKFDDTEIRRLFTDCAYPPNAMSIYYTSLASVK